MKFEKATKKDARLRCAFIGPAGSGKTYSSLAVASNLIMNGRVGLVDTERGSSVKYSDIFDFDVLPLDSFHPGKLIEAIKLAEDPLSGIDVLIIDSLSHFWMGTDGSLALVDKETAKDKSRNSFAAWRTVTPLHNAMIDAIIRCKIHIIATMRSKTEWIMDKDERGRTQVRKVGLAPIQRDGLEYEFDIVGDLDDHSNLIITKSRCPALSGGMIPKPGKEFAETVKAWLIAGVATGKPESVPELKPEPKTEPKTEPQSQQEQPASEPAQSTDTQPETATAIEQPTTDTNESTESAQPSESPEPTIAERTIAEKSALVFKWLTLKSPEHLAQAKDFVEFKLTEACADGPRWQDAEGDRLEQLVVMLRDVISPELRHYFKAAMAEKQHR